MRNREALDTPETHGSSAKQACLNHHLMALQTRRQLLALAAQGADEEKLNVIAEELDLDPDADENDSDLEMLDSDDNGNHSFATSSTLHSSQPPSSRPLLAAATSRSTVPTKRKRPSNKKKSTEFVHDEDDDLGSGKRDHLSIQCVSG